MQRLGDRRVIIGAHDGRMMTQQLGFSIVSAPLAAIDRRALSQAWYSALHLSHDVPSPRASVPKLPELVFHERMEQNSSTPPKARARVVLERAAVPRRAAARPFHTLERRAERSSLARKIERTFLNPRRPRTRATFAIEGSKSRVHVALQTSGNRVRLIAICPPLARTAVREALAQARFALAARGIDLTFEAWEA